MFDLFILPFLWSPMEVWGDRETATAWSGLLPPADCAHVPSCNWWHWEGVKETQPSLPKVPLTSCTHCSHPEPGGTKALSRRWVSVPSSCPFLSQTSRDCVILALHSGLSWRRFLLGKSRRAVGQQVVHCWGLRRTCITRNCQDRGRGKQQQTVRAATAFLHHLRRSLCVSSCA